MWLVGGAPRDLLLGRRLTDVDLACAGDPAKVARALRASMRGGIFKLSDRFGTWRVISDDGAWHVDVSALRGDSIASDLAQRDFTVNAIALPLDGAAALDPYDGAGDLAGRRLRVIDRAAYVDDPLRMLRLARFASTLGLDPDERTLALTRELASAITRPASERVYTELRALVGSGDVMRGVRLLEETGLMAELLPELAALRGIEQSAYHHLDAYEHTLEVLERMIALEGDLAGTFGQAAAGPLAAELDVTVGDGLTRAQVLRFACLFHDLGKAGTRTEFDDGRVGFPGHDEVGAKLVRAIGRRLRMSRRVIDCLAALTRHHLVLGYLAPERPLTRRQTYAYLKTCAPVEVEVTVLSVADRLATRGRKADAAIERHLALARDVLPEALALRAQRAGPPLVRGDELAGALGITPGDQLARLLEAIAEERFVGEISTADQAVRFAREALRKAPPGAA